MSGPAAPTGDQHPGRPDTSDRTVITHAIVNAPAPTRRAVTRASISVLARTSHPAARVCALVDAHLAGGGVAQPDELVAATGTLNAELTGGRQITDPLTHALRHLIDPSAHLDWLATRDVCRTAITAAGWDTWIAAVADQLELGPADARTTLELIRGGVTLAEAVIAGGMLASPAPAAPSAPHGRRRHT